MDVGQKLLSDILLYDALNNWLNKYYTMEDNIQERIRGLSIGILYRTSRVLWINIVNLDREWADVLASFDNISVSVGFSLLRDEQDKEFVDGIPEHVLFVAS